ncbi:MAG: LamG-like jellyroll fold domain-containing protein [Bacteroidales bacterium]
MTKVLSIITLVVFTAMASLGQTIVSTSPENRNAIIEEFTGIACGFCPYGHKAVAEFIQSHPGDGFSIAFHQGAYAQPNPGQPDFTTTYGDGLGSYFNVEGWPTALINRNDFGGGMLYTYNLWQQYASQIITQPSYVNLACEATVDVQTREAIIHVEIYYTGDSPVSTNKLNVAILQNQVKDIQFSSWFNSAAITPDGEYLHQHMFRDFVTGQFGETISPTTSGTFIDRIYEVTIPHEINDIPLWLGNLKILSYIAENEIAVESANDCAITLDNFGFSIDAGIVVLELPETSCSFITPKVLIQNFGSDTITSIDFEVVVNGDEPVPYTWNTEGLLPFTVVDFNLPPVWFGSLGNNSCTVNITAVNNNNDENASNNSASDNFNDAIEVVLPVTLYLTTDNYFGTTWYLYDDQNNVVQQGSGYEANSSFTIPLEVDAGCYKFVMTDLDGYFFGSYALKDGNNMTLVNTTTGFGNHETTAFSLPLYEPTATIDASTSIACLGSTIQFYDASSGGPTEWSWVFEGGIPETSTEKNPSVTYTETGSFDVTLQVSNFLGNDMITMEDFITITSLSYGNLALEFDGMNDYVEISDASAFNIQDEITMEAWIKPANLNGTQGVLSKNFGNNSHPYQIRLIDDEVMFGFYSNTIGWQPVETTNANLIAGDWTHIACTYNMQQVKIYVNGIQKAVAYKSFQIPENDQPFEIGRTKDLGFEYFTGTIDEVRVWDKSLNAGEVLENMCTNYTGVADPNLIAYFKFNECGGTLLSELANGHHGELLNMTGDEWIESLACPGYSIAFQVVEDPGAVPVENALVNMNGTIQFTGLNGEALFEGYEPGDYIYSVEKDGFSVETGSFELTNDNLTIDVHLIISKVSDSFVENILVSPNPSKGMLSISTNRNITIEIISSEGAITNRYHFNEGYHLLNLTSQPKGLYLLKIVDGEQVICKKIMLY